MIRLASLSVLVLALGTLASPAVANDSEQALYERQRAYEQHHLGDHAAQDAARHEWHARRDAAMGDYEGAREAHQRAHEAADDARRHYGRSRHEESHSRHEFDSEGW